MKKILTLEEALAEIDSKKVVKTPLEQLEPTAEKKELVKKNAKPEAREVNSPATNAAKIAYDAQNVLNFYIKKIPNVKVIDSQIAILKQEIIIYNKNGSKDNFNLAKEMLEILVAKRNKIKSVFSPKGQSVKDAAKKIEIQNNINNSETIKELRVLQKDLLKQVKDTTPNSIMREFNKLRGQMKLREALDNSDEVLNFDDLAVEEFDENKSYSELETLFYDKCLFISNIIGKSVKDIYGMKENDILRMLKESLKNNTEIKDKLLRVKMEIAHEKSKISETVSVTEIIHNIFDFKSDETQGKIPKDILAATHVGLVNAIAYKIASQQNRLKDINDAVCGGMLGLVIAINKWYSLQVISDTPLSFKDFANIYISNNAKRALYELSASGISGSGLASIQTQEKQKYENFVKFNPQFKDLDNKVVMDIIDNISEKVSDKPLNMVSETDYNATIGGDDGEVDMWSLSSYDKDEYDPIEAKDNYVRLIKSISELMELFDSKVDGDGVISHTNKKLFDKYDRKIFLMNFGIDYKRDRDDDGKMKTRNLYTQEEMCLEIEAMFRADGQLGKDAKPKTMSQPGLNYRISQIMKKIKSAMDFNPKLKTGFEYLYNYWMFNQEALNDMSNYREEIGMSLDRAELKEIYSDNEQQLNRQLTDGKRLSDVFEITEDNPFDDEISEMFNEFS